MNCTGCHAHGGGAIGPPLMDDSWIYGSHPDQIFATIVEGRPNGMPSFRGKLPDYEIWQLAAYVRSLSGANAAARRSGTRRRSANENAGEFGHQRNAEGHVRTKIRGGAAMIRLRWRSVWRQALLAALSATLLAACGGPQSVVDSAGIQAGRLESLWWLFFGITASVYVLVMAVLLTALFKRKRATAETPPDIVPDKRRETRTANVIKAAVAVTAITLFAR